MLNRLQLGLVLLAIISQATAQDKPPRSLDPRLKIELFAEHPQIVTPTGIDVDAQGRVWAIESNTHFPPPDYAGHKTDRLLVMQRHQRRRAGRSDRHLRRRLHARHERLRATARRGRQGRSRSTSPRGERSCILTDADGDLRADDRQRIVHLDTPGNYPHNGLAGFAFDALGWMYFGFGENLGAEYKIIGSDGRTLSGGGEGGNIYRCRPDGTKLVQWATGFWNPHASCFDAFGRMFTVDNDPDSRPPCRLLHIIRDGDYGYRFRNGRKGLHPFTAWNGEIPGTLPMVAGTGEAPSGIVAYESDGLPEEYLGNLLVTSWGDHRIDRFRLKAKGASYESLAEPLIVGGENFPTRRPRRRSRRQPLLHRLGAQGLQAARERPCVADQQCCTARAARSFWTAPSAEVALARKTLNDLFRTPRRVGEIAIERSDLDDPFLFSATVQCVARVTDEEQLRSALCTHFDAVREEVDKPGASLAPGCASQVSKRSKMAEVWPRFFGSPRPSLGSAMGSRREVEGTSPPGRSAAEPVANDDGPVPGDACGLGAARWR